jgi:hypothetical protein
VSAAISPTADEKFLLKGLTTPMLFCETGVTETRVIVNVHHSETWLPLDSPDTTQIYVQRVAYAKKQTIPHGTKPVWLSETLITYLNDGDQLQVTARTIRFVLFCLVSFLASQCMHARLYTYCSGINNS